MTVNKVINPPKTTGSRLVELYEGRLRDWANELQSTPGLVVAISRKGPRLIELLIREGLLPPGFMSRVISEYALPFVRRCPGSLVIADDAMTYGSTFSKTIALAREVGSQCQPRPEVVGLPFAISDEAADEYKSLASKYYLRLRIGEAAAFVRNEVTAFRLLGKPFDIDHPILTLSGDFENHYRLEGILSEVASRLGGTLIPLDTNVPIASGKITVRAWTVLLDPCPNKASGTPGICKLRIYLAANAKLRVAAMSPFTVNRAELDHYESSVSMQLNQMWEDLVACGGAGSDLFKNAYQRSLATWASFLASTSLLRLSKEAFIEEFGSQKLAVSWVGPRQDDLRLLVGPDFCEIAERELMASLECSSASVTDVEVTQPSINDLEKELIPSEYFDAYNASLCDFLSRSSDVDDALKSVFYAQHTAIELPSRKDRKNGNKRLQFGLAYGRLRSLIQQTVGSRDDAVFHQCLDKLIDDGCVVPILVNTGEGDNQEWIHVFRVGEGPIPTTVHTLRLLFEALIKDSGTDEVPRLLFEKFCVLALSVASDNKDLTSLQRVELKKGFHLYGARIMLDTGERQEFLLDWAVNHEVLSRKGSGDSIESSGSYRLDQNIERIFPSSESPWDADVKDAVDDLAFLVRAVNGASGLKGPALIALTSVASNQELHTAIEAELNLWLHDDRFSVYDGLRQLSALASVASSRKTLPKAELEKVSVVLSNVANFTAQVNEKKLLAERRNEIYTAIDALAASDTRMQRTWRKLRLTLDGRLRSEANSSGYSEILSALRIAYGTNRLLRDLLTLAGYADPLGKSQPLERSVDALRATLDDRTQVDQPTRTMFAAKDGRPDVSNMLAQILPELPCSFAKALELLRAPILEIAYRCEDVLRAFSSTDHNELKEPLEPPKYLLMWDTRGSTEAPSREPLERLIGKANARVTATLGNRAIDFKPDRDDGNGLICDGFSDVVTVFQILLEVYAGIPFRAGCDVNLQGRLDYYKTTRELGGRAFEFAARVTSMFKELGSDPNRWAGGTPPAEPDVSYLIVSEFARRFAEKENQWPPEQLKVYEPQGRYTARVRTGLPVSVSILLSDV